MGPRKQELTAVAAAPSPDAAAAATEEPPPALPLPLPEEKGKEPARVLKKRKKDEEQEAALSHAAAADDASATKAGGAHDKHVADASRSDGDGSKTKKRKADQHGSDDDHGASVDDDEKDGDDQVHVYVHQQEAECRVQNMGSPRGSPVMSLAPRRKKKLLILDLNGLLADINQDKHNAHLSHGKFRGKLVFKRPYCDDFLRFCILHFELGIWSSRLRANVDAVVNILMEDLKHHLLFCWDMSKCTCTGFNTLENKVKPLVLKELKKLWDKEPDDLPWQQGDFSPSNTLLVDDSPYKALRNPPHTAIFPCPYSYKNDKDDALGPDGDLRLYLEGLAAADNVQRYVREHPFGQPPITETDPDWEFYRRILIE